MYSDLVIEHFRNPQNWGKLDDADAIGQEGNPVCGDVLKIYLKIKDKVITDIRFETLGCAAAIAVSSVLTEKVKGLTLEQALAINKEDLVKELGGLPPIKIHCSVLGIDALRQAINNYQVDVK